MWRARTLLAGLGMALAFTTMKHLSAQELATPLQSEQIATGKPPVAIEPPSPAPTDRPLPINLPTALQLSSNRPIDIAVASERIQVAVAQLRQARVLWLPTLQFGIDYFHHDGRIQDTPGTIMDTSKGSFMLGAAPIAVFAVSDAIFVPLATRQIVRAREADLRAATNDSFLAVAEAYFNVEQAQGELAGALDAMRRSERLVAITEQLAKPGVQIIQPVEVVRARTELARRRQVVHSARERWRLASADLVRILRLDPGSVIQPLEPPHLRVTLIGLENALDDLIPIGLTNRPELAAQQALVQATLQRLRQERIRPLVPSVLLRGASTNPAGTLAAGTFGGGLNDTLNRFGSRSDFDVQVLWELQNLGFGNRARVAERRADHQLSMLELFRIQDRVAADVSQAYAQAESAAARIKEAEIELKDAVDSVEKNVAGMRQTREAGNALAFFNRPQEVVAAIQALAQAYFDYYGAVGDYNRGQFRLYRALGNPAQFTGGQGLCAPAVSMPCLGAPARK
jgi:outer membrane protein TolC